MQANIQWLTQRANSLYLLLNRLNAGQLNIYGTTHIIPTQTSIANGFVAANYADNLLLSYSINSINLFARTDDNYQRLFMAQLPNAVNALATDTASWFAIVGSNANYCLVGDVSDTNGTCPLKMLSTSIVSGSSYQIYSLGFVLHQ